MCSQSAMSEESSCRKHVVISSSTKDSWWHYRAMSCCCAAPCSSDHLLHEWEGPAGGCLLPSFVYLYAEKIKIIKDDEVNEGNVGR